MRWPARRPRAWVKAAFHAWALLALVLLCWPLRCAVAGPAVPPTILLDEAGGPRRDAPAGLEWTDAGGSTTLGQLLAGDAGAFTPLDPERIRSLGTAGALWLHLRVARPPDSHTAWVAELPLPPLDAVTLYQPDGKGGWRAQSAGDRLPVVSWPEPGRYPVFQLEVPPGQTQDLYFRVQHNARSNIPLRIATLNDHALRTQLAYLGLGLVLGGLILLIATCLVQSWVFRDRAFFGYAGYATTMALALAAFTGAAGHLLWPRSGFVADAAQGGLALLSAAAAILFVRDLSGIGVRAPRLAAFALSSGLAGPVLLVVYSWMDRPPASILMGSYLALACALNLAIAWRSWRAGDKPSPWILAAYLPLAVALAATLGRVFGLAPASWANQYGMVAAMAFQVPLLLVALSIHSRERHGATTRELALSSQDALTGLLAPHLFHDRLRQMAARNRSGGESAAVLFIDLANYPAIRAQHGSAVAEQSLLRSVIKLRRVAREIDTLSRIGESRFGLLLERAGSRMAVTDRAARAIAAGIMPGKGQKPDLTLQFHVAAVLLDEVALETPQLAAALGALLDSMEPGTRRPIRFLGAPVTVPLELRASGTQDAADSGLPSAPGAAAS
jgi:GGDEF domain-containing protein